MLKRNVLRIITLAIIFAFIAGIILAVYFFIQGYRLDNLVNFIAGNLVLGIVIFSLLYLTRVFILLPATPIILVSGIVFQNFILTSIIAFLGIALGLTVTYFIGYIFEENLKTKKIYKKMIPYIEKVRENGFKIILTGCFAPMLPTDAICYSAGFIRYNYFKFLLAGMIGELPLIIGYSYLGKKMGDYSEYLVYVFIVLILAFGGSILFEYLRKKRLKN